jgi:hypothetical protein
MPTRIYNEDPIRKRKLLGSDEKPVRKYSKALKDEIKLETLSGIQLFLKIFLNFS